MAHNQLHTYNAGQVQIYNDYLLHVKWLIFHENSGQEQNFYLLESGIILYEWNFINNNF